MIDMQIVFDFPREVMELSPERGRGYRKIVKSNGDLERYWEGKNGVSNAYMTVYGYRATLPPYNKRVNLETPIVRHFVMDFDPKDFRKNKGNNVDPEAPLVQTKKLHQFLLERDITHGVWYSGGGFHIWIGLDKAYIPSNGDSLSDIKEAGMKIVSDWIYTMDLYCSDPAVPFDTSGMIRIPNSYNSKRGLWSIPLSTQDLEAGLAHITEKALDPGQGMIPYGNQGLKLEVVKGKSRGKVFNPNSKPLDLPTISMDGVIILPCLNSAACRVGSNPSHDERVQLVKYLSKRLRNFMPVERIERSKIEEHTETIVNFIRSLEWADFREETTRYQVGTIIGTEYPQTCSMLYKKGMCLGKCRYWDKTGAIDKGEEE
ncbi:MAG: hypothetical protein CMI60_17440 [Parvibaculum sp.]|nr:hypothetical protein [Parvibaculum sp.]